MFLYLRTRHNSRFGILLHINFNMICSAYTKALHCNSVQHVLQFVMHQLKVYLFVYGMSALAGADTTVISFFVSEAPLSECCR